ncbi:uncharacterized protein MYCFIDRAFT_209761 [Pseudocercospora fijiensis CIRAD86]|uniref:Thioredoxin domain-containing protein n=1 Tax=Pseudocercospora fijiensis (strain CIRAD86) TaxID=383855 RepID=N1Q6V3_PSEFD|nr:uncharacterized protein MYCFIDRAFT_209761 [Pseudocercospora fijiensis CIRAD86]EME88279.1 hypothetical protein MYCFIDRAFT_209761 [Pseudocercospora fijiensis CIRAD86]
MASSPAQLHPIATEADFNTTIQQIPAECLTVIYFHAPWAEPCKQMSTILTTLASTYEHTTPPRIAFLSLDAEEVADVSERYDVTQVPFVVLQKNGQVLESVTGTDAAKVRSAVERHAGEDGKPGASLPPKQNVTPQTHNDATMGGVSSGNMSQYKHGPGEQQSAPHSSDGQLNGAPSKEELNKRLAELVKAAPVMLFMKGTPSAPQCGFSRQTVAILREKGVRYGFFNILADDEVRQGLKEFSDWPTFPQVYMDGELVGGLDILKEEFENNPDFMSDYQVKKAAQAA